MAAVWLSKTATHSKSKPSGSSLSGRERVSGRVCLGRAKRAQRKEVVATWRPRGVVAKVFWGGWVDLPPTARDSARSSHRRAAATRQGRARVVSVVGVGRSALPPALLSEHMCDLASRRGGSGGLPPTARDFARFCHRRAAAVAALFLLLASLAPPLPPRSPASAAEELAFFARAHVRPRRSPRPPPTAEDFARFCHRRAAAAAAPFFFFLLASLAPPLPPPLARFRRGRTRLLCARFARAGGGSSGLTGRRRSCRRWSR
jgi:hypothetical protein